MLVSLHVDKSKKKKKKSKTIIKSVKLQFGKKRIVQMFTYYRLQRIVWYSLVPSESHLAAT